MRSTTKGGMLAAIMLAASGLGAGAGMSGAVHNIVAKVADTTVSPKIANRIAVTNGTQQAVRNGDGGRSRSPWTYPRPGWSVRQGQRMARKKAARARNRRAHR